VRGQARLEAGDLARIGIRPVRDHASGGTAPVRRDRPPMDLLDLLAEAAWAEPAFRVRMATEATSVIRERGRVVGVAYRTTTGSAGETRAALTVACDRRRSLPRGASGLTGPSCAVWPLRESGGRASRRVTACRPGDPPRGGSAPCEQGRGGGRPGPSR